MFRATVFLALLLVAACGGGAGSDDPAEDTSSGGNTTTNGGGGNGGADQGMVLPPFDATTLSGGVLATFAVGQEKFRGWFTRAEDTQRLVGAFAGTAAPVTSICMRLREGAGVQDHNAPWSWSVVEILPSNMDGFCPACASTRPTPSDAEAAVNTPAWFNCVLPVGNSVSIEARAFMVVTLIDVVDRR